MIRAAALLAASAVPAAAQSFVGTWTCTGVGNEAASSFVVTYSRTGSFSARHDLHMSSPYFGTSDIVAEVDGRWSAEETGPGRARLRETAETGQVENFAFMGAPAREQSTLDGLVEELIEIVSGETAVFWDDADTYVRMEARPYRAECHRSE
ncbi:hypothetical protein HKCCE3408_18510 [Rhodobacterales bacterium HKCCE3408]|nr:hypothetical protein [Rhodobacterales bacterium HKCCE3408]